MQLGPQRPLNHKGELIWELRGHFEGCEYVPKIASDFDSALVGCYVYEVCIDVLIQTYNVHARMKNYYKDDHHLGFYKIYEPVFFLNRRFFKLTEIHIENVNLWYVRNGTHFKIVSNSNFCNKLANSLAFKFKSFHFIDTRSINIFP